MNFPGHFSRVRSDHGELRKTLPDTFSSKAKKSIGKVYGSRRESIFRVGGAVLFGAGLVGVAFFANQHALRAQTTRAPAVIVARGDVRTMQPAPDTDGDRIPDWEEVLQGIDPDTYTTVVAPTSTPPAAGEPYERPTTLTGQFAEYFLKDIVRAGAGKDITPEEQEALVSRSIGTLSSATKEKLYTRADIRTTGNNDLIALHSYGNAVGDILLANKVTREGPDKFTVFKQALDEHNPKLLAALAPIEEAYASIMSDLLALEAPTNIAKQHVDFINALSMVRADVTAMEQAFTDPLGALMHVKRYTDDARGLSYAVDQVRIALEASEVAYTSDEPGITLFRFRP